MEYQAHDGNKYLDGILSLWQLLAFLCAFEKNDDSAVVYLDALLSALKSFS